MRSFRQNARTMLLAAGLAVALAGPSFGLDCPDKPIVGVTGLGPAAAQKADLMVRDLALTQGHRPTDASAIIAFIRANVPGAEPASIVNFLIASYCPYVARRNDLDEAGKTQTVQDFAADVARLLY